MPNRTHTNTDPAFRGLNVYKALIDERLICGRVLIDTLSHTPADKDALLRILLWQERLETRLQPFRRWSHDADLVFQIEERRWHQPPAQPADQLQRPCRLCLIGSLPTSVPRPIQVVG